MKRTILVLLIMSIALLSAQAFDLHKAFVNKQIKLLSKISNEHTRDYYDPILNEVYPELLTLTKLYGMYGNTSIRMYTWADGAWNETGSVILEYSGDQVSRMIIDMAFGRDRMSVIYDVTWNSGNITQIDMAYDMGDTPIATGRETYTYGNSGELTEAVMQIPDPIDGTWTNEDRLLYTYTGSDLTESLSQYNDESVWTDDRKCLLAYSNGKVSTINEQEFDQINWVDVYNNTYAYSGDNLVEEIEQEWQTDAWQNVEKTTYQFSRSMPSAWSEFFWSSDDWIETQRGTISFNTENKPVEFLSQVQSIISREWENEGKVVFGYGDNAIDDVNAAKSVLSLSNYPNPFNPETTLNFNLVSDSNVEISVYNVKGQKVDTIVNKGFTKGNHNITWKADSFSTGVYFAVLKTKSGTTTAKLVLMK